EMLTGFAPAMVPMGEPEGPSRTGLPTCAATVHVVGLSLKRATAMKAPCVGSVAVAAAVLASRRGSAPKATWPFPPRKETWLRYWRNCAEPEVLVVKPEPSVIGVGSAAVRVATMAPVESTAKRLTAFTLSPGLVARARDA